MAGTVVGCIRIVGFACGWVADREEGHSENLDLDLDLDPDLVARGLESVIVGRTGCLRSIED